MRVPARSAALLAGSLWLVILALSAAELLLIALTLDRPPDQWGIRGYEAGLALAFGSMGALVAIRRRGNAIGWVMLAVSLVLAIQGIVIQYPALAEASDRPLAGAFAARWVSAWIWVIAVGTFLTVFPLIFPNGRLVSPRWRPALLLAFAAMGIQIIIIINTEPLGPVPASNNPAPYFAIAGLRGTIGYILLWVAGAVSVSSLVQRYRGAGTEERQQIKWVVYAVLLMVVGALIGMTPFVIGQVFFLGTAFVAAAVATFAWGYLVLRPAGERFSRESAAWSGAPDELPAELVELRDRLRTIVLAELLGFLVVFTTMILMHAASEG